MTRLLAVILSLLLAIAPAWADMSMLGVGGTGGGYTGPGDIRHNNAMAYYGLRCFRASQASLAKVINVRRASDNTTTDVGFDANCNLDPTLNTGGHFCNGTTCFIHTWYDTNTDNTSCGSSVTCDLVQATTAQQPQLIFSCLGSLPCVRFTAASSTNLKMTATCSGAGCATQLATYEATWENTGTAGYMFSCGSGGSVSCGLNATGSNQMGVYFGGTGANISASDNAFHVETGVEKTTVGYVCADNTLCSTPSAVGVSAVITPFVMGEINGGNFFSGNVVEMTIYANYTLTSAEQAELCHSSYIYWGTSTAC